MIELNQTSKYERLKDKLVASFLGRTALNSQPMVDERLVLQFRKPSIDDEYGDVNAEWYTFFGTGDMSIPVIVDEYGIDTVYEPTQDQIEELCRNSDQDASITNIMSTSHFYNLAREGREAIDNPRHRYNDETAVAKLFENDIKMLKRGVKHPSLYVRKELNYRLNQVLFDKYHADSQILSVAAGEEI